MPVSRRVLPAVSRLDLAWNRCGTLRWKGPGSAARSDARSASGFRTAPRSGSIIAPKHRAQPLTCRPGWFRTDGGRTGGRKRHEGLQAIVAAAGIGADRPVLRVRRRCESGAGAGSGARAGPTEFVGAQAGGSAWCQAPAGAACDPNYAAPGAVTRDSTASCRDEPSTRRSHAASGAGLPAGYHSGSARDAASEGASRPDRARNPKVKIKPKQEPKVTKTAAPALPGISREEATSPDTLLIVGGLALFFLVLADVVFLALSTRVLRTR